jgi:hypothetical protein
MTVGSTIAVRITQKLSDHYNVTDISQVTFEMIADMAEKYLAADEVLQLNFCRDPSRQSIDEEVQAATLKKYLPACQVVKPTNGNLTLLNGDISKKSKVNKAQARSIDLVITTHNKEVNVFAKYAAVAGSAQNAQMEESERFIAQAKLYTDKHADNKCFVVLTDGVWGESHHTYMNSLTAEYDNIFAGNCESVISWISKL